MPTLRRSSGSRGRLGKHGCLGQYRRLGKRRRRPDRMGSRLYRSCLRADHLAHDHTVVHHASCKITHRFPASFNDAAECRDRRADANGGDVALVAPHRAAGTVAMVIVAGAGALVAFFPHTLSQPLLFAVLLLFACMTSAWKVTLPILVASGSTLSGSYAANLMSLLLLGAEPAIIIAVVGVWTQCRYNSGSDIRCIALVVSRSQCRRWSRRRRGPRRLWAAHRPSELLGLA